MKKGTLCLLGDMETENYIRSIMLEGAMKGGLGVAAASLPRHISLGMPYEIRDLDEYIAYAEQLASSLHPVTVKLSDMGCGKIGETTGSYFLRFEENFGLENLRQGVKKELVEKLGLTLPEKDGVAGQKTITLGFGTAPYEKYSEFVSGFDKTRFVGKECRFDEFGIFYYDEPTISASTFFCCKRFKLN